MEQIKNLRNRPTQVDSIDVWQKCKNNSMEEGRSFQYKVLEHWDIHGQKKKSHLIQNLTQM